MIKVTTDCAACQHLKVCRYTNNAVTDADKLSEMIYDEDQNDEYSSWAVMSHARNVTITFSCDSFEKRPEVLHR